MFISRHRMKALLFSASLILIASLSSSAQQQPQQPASPASQARARGIALYQQNDTNGAIKALREAVKKDKYDADAWYFLGLALNRADEIKEARKAFENAVGLRPNLSNTHAGLAYNLLLSNKLNDAVREADLALSLDAKNADAHYVLAVVALYRADNLKAVTESSAALGLKPTLAPALLVKSQALANLYFADSASDSTAKVTPQSEAARPQMIKEAVESLEQYIKLSPPDVTTWVWKEQLEDLRFYAELADHSKPDSARTVFSTKEVTSKARILSRPEPQYTESARRANISGTVVVRVILDTDGLVKHILVVRSLSHGLTEQAVKVARRIKFIPAEKDGRPVAQMVQIEYNFNLY